MTDQEKTTFKDLGLCQELCDACSAMGWDKPSAIQREAIPVALQGKDVVGLAETGSGKTAAFGLPILHHLLDNPQPYFALILSPTWELAGQIKEQLDALGKEFDLQCCTVVGGNDMLSQARMVLKKPHIIIATLGRLAQFAKELKGFSTLLAGVKYLVMDEADRILSKDFEDELDCIIRCLSKKRRTMLFSATITNKVSELTRAHLKDAVRVKINSTFKIVDTLKQYMLPVAYTEKHMYLIFLIRKLIDKSMIVFCNTRKYTLKTALILRQCGHKAIPLYGDMDHKKRLAALTKFKSQERSVLVATDVASRGLDIPCVDYVLNFEVPNKSEDYIHRVGRTARAGRSGVSITFVSQYEFEDFLRIEQLIMKHTGEGKMEPYAVMPADVKPLEDVVNEAEKKARVDLRRMQDQSKGRESDDDDEDSSGVRKRLKRQNDQQGHNNKKKFKRRK